MSIFLLGILGGLAGGLLGIGGGTIFIPILVLVLNYEQHLAQGTALFTMIPTSLAGAYSYSKKKNVDLKIVYLLILGAVLGAPLGSYIAIKIPTLLLKKIFGIFICLIGIKMILGK